MCGIFGVLHATNVSKFDLKAVVQTAERRGSDASGLILWDKSRYVVSRCRGSISALLRRSSITTASFIFGHSRLITNGEFDNQPIVREGISIFHNGIITNDRDIWGRIRVVRKLETDTEALFGLAQEGINNGLDLEEIGREILKSCSGSVSCAILFHQIGKILLLSNNGSLFVGSRSGSMFYHSERYPLVKLGCGDIHQIKNSFLMFDIPATSDTNINEIEYKTYSSQKLSKLGLNNAEQNLLEYKAHNIKRCTKCILPETMRHHNISSLIIEELESVGFFALNRVLDS